MILLNQFASLKIENARQRQLAGVHVLMGENDPTWQLESYHLPIVSQLGVVRWMTHLNSSYHCGD